MTIESMIDATIGKEGAYSDNPNDPGGATMWGITAWVARKNGYTGDMRLLPRDKAVAIYRQEYAIAPGFAAVALIAPTIGAELFDTGVNMGPKVASQFLQRSLNVLNNQGRDYPDIVADGIVGAGTLAALRAFLAKRGDEGVRRLLALLNALQGERYVSLCEGRSANEVFMYGWLARVAA